MSESTKPKKFKRYCKTLTLKDDPELIREYERVHAPENSWPEIGEGMKEVGILDMEIYRFGNHLFMIMDTVLNFDHDQAMKELGSKPRQREWESFVSKFQATSEDASAADKWQFMDRIYKLDQKENYDAKEGQIEICSGAKNFK